MRERIESLEDSYLEEVIARIALHSFKNYDQLNDMKYKLKVRIKQLDEETITPHLHKYYYDYVMKMARIFKQLDEELPLRDILGYVVKNDPNDVRYQLELTWFEFCMGARKSEEGERKGLMEKSIKEIRNIYDNLELSQQSTALRRIITFKIFGGSKDLDEDIDKLLENERSFDNLQCAAVYNYWKGQHKESLLLLREAYKINQSSYHLNRLYFLSLYKCG